jgi:thioredoxin-like negative regulator of GroEL
MIIKVLNYRQIIANIQKEKYNVIQFTSNCQASNNLRARMSGIHINAYDIVYERNRPIGALFEIKQIPCAILLEHGLPVARASGASEIEPFLDVVEDALRGMSPV